MRLQVTLENLIGANFHVTATSIPGFNPVNQALEVKHRVEKMSNFGINGESSVGQYFAIYLPRKLAAQGRDLCMKPVHLVSPPEDTCQTDIKLPPLWNYCMKKTMT